MRILVAGATGAIGKRLVPGLVAAGHHVVATSRSRDKLNCLRSEGAEAVLMDGLDADGVLREVTAARPDVIVHQMTALAPMLNTKRFDDELALTNRLRTEGTGHLVSAAIGAGVRRLVAQSYTGWPNQRQGGRVKTETDPLDPAPPVPMRKSLGAIETLERMVLNTAAALRYAVCMVPARRFHPVANSLSSFDSGGSR